MWPSQFLWHRPQCDRPSFYDILNDTVTVPVFMVSTLTMWPSQFSYYYPQWQCDFPVFMVSSMTMWPSQFSYYYPQWQCDRPSFHGILSVTVLFFMVSSVWPSQFLWHRLRFDRQFFIESFITFISERSLLAKLNSNLHGGVVVAVTYWKFVVVDGVCCHLKTTGARMCLTLSGQSVQLSCCWCFYIGLFSALEQNHCARMWFYMSE